MGYCNVDDQSLDQLVRAAERELCHVPDINTLKELVAAYRLQAATIERFEIEQGLRPVPKVTVNTGDLLS